MVQATQGFSRVLARTYSRSISFQHSPQPTSKASCNTSIVPLTFLEKVTPLPLRADPLFTRQPLPLPPLQALRILAVIAREIAGRRLLVGEEIADEPMPAFTGAFAVIDQLLETLRPVLGLGCFCLSGGVGVVGVVAASGAVPCHAVRDSVPVFPRVKKYARGRFSIPSCSSCFLVKAFE